MAELIPFSLKNAPALIEAVFPAQKISFEAQRERKAGAGQTLTSLGSYWKGRKPLILVRSLLIGALLPQTDNIEKDLEIFEKLLGIDDLSLAKRALENNAFPPSVIIESISLDDPSQFFQIDSTTVLDVAFDSMKMPTTKKGAKVKWKSTITKEQKVIVYLKVIQSLSSYEEKAKQCLRPEELDPGFLYDEAISAANNHYKSLGVNAKSLDDLLAQIGLLRFGHCPIVGDTFSGGGSIPFEAGRIGCEAYASDLNPIACMLNWASVNVLGLKNRKRNEVLAIQRKVLADVEIELKNLGIEENDNGDRAKSYLYCLETECPETGWIVPLSTTWVISRNKNVIARLIPDYSRKRFEIEVVSGVSNQEISQAKLGTIQKGFLVYTLDGKEYRTPIKTLRGDYKDSKGQAKNKLRCWEKSDFMPIEEDLFQERLYAVQWIRKHSLDKARPETFFAAPTSEDLKHEINIENIVRDNLNLWQENGFIPDMEIEPGYNTAQPVRERGWTHWHHLFTPRQLLFFKLLREKAIERDALTYFYPLIAKALDRSTKLCRWTPGSPAKPGVAVTAEKVSQVFDNQALNTFFNYASRSGYEMLQYLDRYEQRDIDFKGKMTVKSKSAENVTDVCDLWITDPPYADAVNYHEITEFFIAWLRKNPPKPFDEWTWDSRRALAIKGSGDDFRKGMVNAYKAMAGHMPDNGMQCVMFTHQDTGVWSDMIGIFWASGLQVVGAWYIATETSTELKKGGYVQGTVILMLRKRPAGENAGFKQRLLPAVRAEVKRQIETMMHLNDEVKDKLGEPVFNDSDLQMAGYAAALKVLTSYTHIGGEDVTSFALRPRAKGEVTVVDEIVQQAAEAANSLLVPEGLSPDTWQKINGIQRFYLRMMDIETTGATKLDNYQNFAKAFRVDDYARVMGNMAANKAQLKQIPEFASRDLTDSTEIGSTWLGHLIIGLQQILDEKEPQTVISQLQGELPDFMEVRPILIDILAFIEKKAPAQATRDAAEVLGARMKNMRALGQ